MATIIGPATAQAPRDGLAGEVHHVVQQHGGFPQGLQEPWEELHHLRRDSRDSRDSRNSSTKDGWMRMENPCQISKIGVFNDDLQIGGE